MDAREQAEANLIAGLEHFAEQERQEVRAMANENSVAAYDDYMESINAPEDGADPVNGDPA